MEQTPFSEKRAHPRFAVSGLHFLKARLDRSSSSEKILTLGEGGCGFFGYDKSWEKAPVKRVFSTFELVTPIKVGPVTVQGNIVYIKPMLVKGQQLYYFGIQFLPEEKARVLPLIEALENLETQGFIKAAL